MELTIKRLHFFIATFQIVSRNKKETISIIQFLFIKFGASQG